MTLSVAMSCGEVMVTVAVLAVAPPDAVAPPEPAPPAPPAAVVVLSLLQAVSDNTGANTATTQRLLTFRITKLLLNRGGTIPAKIRLRTATRCRQISGKAGPPKHGDSVVRRAGLLPARPVRTGANAHSAACAHRKRSVNQHLAHHRGPPIATRSAHIVKRAALGDARGESFGLPSRYTTQRN